MRKVYGVLLGIALSATAVAGTQLSGEQIKLLVSGNTVELTSISKGSDFKVYFKADGTATSFNESKSKKGKGTWRITDAGEHCTKWGKKDETCGQVIDMGNGTYTRMFEGSPRATWNKVSPGNPFNL